ncbi:MAG: hypothetical protein IKH21_05645, partial [Clostridia bacterium]|nr:hypothetical protein [Clostridia bacterium]
MSYDDVSKVYSHSFSNSADAVISHILLLDEINRQIPNTIAKYKSIDWIDGSPSGNAPVWVCWLDGANELPDLVSRCIRSICDHSGGHPVKFIDYNNIIKYVSIPERIAELRDEGKLCLANYTDVLRLMLLFEHGGLWVDADTFVSRDIPDEFFSKPFVTVKNDIVDISPKESLKYVGCGKWHVSIMGGQKGNSLLGFLLDAFLEFLSKKSELPSYYYLDYTIELARRQFPKAAAALKAGAIYNGRHRKLSVGLKRGYPQGAYKDLIPTDTVFNVLNRKRELPLVTEEGEATAYSEFLKNPKADAD